MVSARERSSRASPSKRAEDRFLQPLFRGTQEVRGTPPDSRSQAHQQSALQKCSGDWFVFMDLKDAYFHIRIAPHHRCYLRFAFEGTAYQYSVLPFGLAQGERDTHPQLSGRLADFSSVPGHATQPHRLAAYSLGVPTAMSQHAESILAPASCEIAWG